MGEMVVVGSGDVARHVTTTTTSSPHWSVWWSINSIRMTRERQWWESVVWIGFNGKNLFRGKINLISKPNIENLDSGLLALLMSALSFLSASAMQGPLIFSLVRLTCAQTNQEIPTTISISLSKFLIFWSDVSYTKDTIITCLCSLAKNYTKTHQKGHSHKQSEKEKEENTQKQMPEEEEEWGTLIRKL